MQERMQAELREKFSRQLVLNAAELQELTSSPQMTDLCTAVLVLRQERTQTNKYNSL